MAAIIPERRTAMYHAHLGMGAVMDDADGWQLPLHYGDAAQEARWLRETVGISDVSPIGKLRVVGADSAQAVAALVSQAATQTVGTVAEADSTLERGGKLLSACLAPGEFLLLTPAGVATDAAAAIQSGPAVGLQDACAYAVDVTSGLCGVAIAGPATQDLMSRITEVDTSSRALPDLSCIQSRFADVQGLLLRRDVNGIAMYQLYAGREFGEYLWETLAETAREVGGGPAGTEALLGLRGTG